jgi:hypothetical protein
LSGPTSRASSGHSRLPGGELATEVFVSGEIRLDPPGITVTVEEVYAD